MKETTVLIADDHKLLRETLTVIINAEPGYKVVASCGDATAAIDIAQAEMPAIILMDINMKPVSGIEATARIIELNPEAKIIGMSTHSEQIYVKKMLKAGARGYLTKNSPKDEIVHAMNHVLQGKTYVCEDIKNIIGQQLDDEPVHIS